jgi:uncharacterized membrane protein
MQTIDVNNNKSSETHFVTVADIQNMDPCSFSNRRNPITKAKCSESFTTANAARVDMPDDPLAQLYFTSLGLIGVYILYRFMEKSR